MLQRQILDLQDQLYVRRAAPRVKLLKSAPGVYEDVRKDWRVSRVEGGYPKSYCWITLDKETGESFDFVSLSEAREYINAENASRYVSDKAPF